MSSSTLLAYDADDLLIDLTDEDPVPQPIKEEPVVNPARTAPASASSLPGTLLAQASAPSPKLLMQQQLFAAFEKNQQQKKKPITTGTKSTPATATTTATATATSYQPPKLQLTNITDSTNTSTSSSSSSVADSNFIPCNNQRLPPPSSLTTTSITSRSSNLLTSTAAARKRTSMGGGVKTELGVKNEQTAASAAAASFYQHTLAASSTAAAAASSPSYSQLSSSAATSGASQSTEQLIFSQPSSSQTSWMSFTPPTTMNSVISTQPQSQHKLPLSAPPAIRPASTSTSAAAASSVGKYVPNEEERLVTRRRELEQQLTEVEAQELALATKRRTIKAEMRSIEEQLNRPMQLPFIQPARPAVAIGGTTALLAGSAYWSGAFPWDAAALETMQRVFKINSYRISQREVINATMERKDTFVIMPTGAGKSLLYQLPAMLNEGVTLVISPLLSLMEDQIINLRAIGIESYMLCGTTSKEDTKYIQAQMLDKDSKMRLLYVTPEKIAKSKQFLSKLEKMYDMGKLVRIVIDEVHCCSNWGHDFRPDYAKLSILKIQFRDVPILAVTATATEQVVEDCKKILAIRGCQFFKCSFNRPNLYYAVRPKSSSNKEVAQDMYDYVASIGHLGSTGIIYAYSKKETMELCSLLSGLGLNCDFYHSDVSPEQRQRLHHRWVQGKVKLIVATNAFGLGINKPDVRYVLHHTFPCSLHMYSQEAGRAGRDGQKSYCCLWYSARDLARQSVRVYHKQDMASHLYPIAAYGHTVDQCRRVMMSRQFGEQFHASQCQNMCDVCDTLTPLPPQRDASSALQPLVPLPPPQIVSRDLSEVAISICEYVAKTNSTSKSGGKRKRANVGTMTQKQLTDECKKRNSSIILPKDLSRDACERLIVELLLQGILKESFKNTAYSTISYIQHDERLLQLLRRGELLIKLNFIEGQHDAATAKKKPAAAKRRSSSKQEQKSDMIDSSDIDDFGGNMDEFLDDAPEPEPEIELDDDDAVEVMEGRGRGIRRADDLDDDEPAASQSSEDQPITTFKRLKRGPPPSVASSATTTTAAAASGTSARRSSSFPSTSYAAAAASSPAHDDFLMDEEDAEAEEAYQAALLESTKPEYL